MLKLNNKYYFKKMKLKKSLGQNFLRNEKIASKIIASAEIKNTDTVLEIGPGDGVLTEKIIKQADKIIAVEIDQRLIPVLQHKFRNFDKIEIIHGDILNMDLRPLVENLPYKLIANIPYYITSKILRIFLELQNPPTEMILMVQKEVAERIAAVPGKMSKLSVMVQYYAHPEILFYVDKKNFEPMPEVDSAIIKIVCKQQLKTDGERKDFFRIVRTGFCARRKTLINNLSNSLHLEKKEIALKLKKLNISSTARAQELSIQKWKELVKEIV